jgi:hypothetical protein
VRPFGRRYVGDLRHAERRRGNHRRFAELGRRWRQQSDISLSVDRGRGNGSEIYGIDQHFDGVLQRRGLQRQLIMNMGDPEHDTTLVTPEMIEAGAEAYLDFDLRGGEIEDRIERAYWAMEKVRRKSLSIVGGSLNPILADGEE